MTLGNAHRGPRFFAALLLTLVVTGVGGIARAATTTLPVLDGMDAPSGNTLAANGDVARLNADSDALDVDIAVGTNLAQNGWIGIRFDESAVPSNHTIQSVVIEFERRLDRPGNKSATLFLDVSVNRNATLWSDGTRGNETGQGMNSQSFPVPGSTVFVQESYDVSPIVTSFAELQNLEVNFRNVDGSDREVYLDFVRVIVTHADTTPPAAVNDLSATAGNAPGDVTLAWTAPGNDGASFNLDNAEFRIQYATTEGASWASANAQVSIATTGVTPGGVQTHTLSLGANTTYYFRIWTVDDAANTSGASNLPNAVTRTVGVSNVSISAVYPSSATLTWTALPASPQSATAEGYRLEASSTNFSGTGTTVVAQTANIAQNTLTTSGLSPNVTYYFRVGTLDWIGAVTYVPGGSTATLPLAPGLGSPAFSTVAQSSIAVQWTSGGNPFGTRYVAEISDNGFASTLASGETTGTSLVFGTGGVGAALVANTTHTVRVRALNHGGAPGAYTVLGATATRAAPPTLEPPGFPAAALSSVTVHWRDDVNPSALYQAEISIDDFDSVLASTQTTGMSAMFGTGGAGPALSANTTHWIRVRAVNHNSVPSAYTALGATATLANLPATPLFENVWISSSAARWSEAAGGARNYRLEASSTSFNGAGTLHAAETADGTGRSLTLSSPALSPNTTYAFRLGAYNWNGRLSSSVIGSTSTLANAPQSPSVSAAYVSSMTANWSAPVGGADGYQLEAAASSDFSGLVLRSSTTDGGATTLSVDGLASETTYHVRVGAFNWNGRLTYAGAGSTTTISSEDSIPPDMIDDLAATAESATSIRLDWTGPFDPTDNPLQGVYAIQYSTWAGVTWSTTNAQVQILTSNVSNGDPQTRVVGGLDPNTTYHLRLWTSDLKPNWSEPSDIKSIMTLANAVTGITIAEKSSTTATVAWTPLPASPASETATGYRVLASSTNFSGGTALSSATANGLLGALTVSGLAPNTTYWFRVGSLNAAWQANDVTEPTTSSLAPDVSRLESDFATVYATSATVQWQGLPAAPPDATSEGYRVQASSMNFTGGTVLSTETTNVLLTSLTVPGLSPNTTYWFRVGALNWSSDANYVALAATMTRANVPLSFAAASAGESGLTGSWMAPAGAVAGYLLQAAATADFGTIAASSETTNGALTTLTVNGLAANTTYFLRVAALNAKGAANFAGSVSTPTLAKAPLRQSSDFVAVHQTSVTVQWQARPASPQSETSEGYRLESSTSVAFTGTMISAVTADHAVQSLALNSLLPGTTYFFRVGSLNWTGAASYTALDSTATLAAVPGTLGTTYPGVFVSSVIAQWSGGANGEGTAYQLQASTASNFTGTLSTASVSASPGIVLSLSPNTVYYLRVRAVNPLGVPSAYTSLGSTRTRANTPAAGAPAFSPVYASSLTVVITAGDPANPSGTAYDVQLSTDAAFATAQTVTGTDLTAAFTGLTPNTSYFARARARNAGGINTAYVSLGSTVTVAAPPAAGSPSFTNVTNSELTLQWSSGTAGVGFNPAGTLYQAQLSESPAFAAISAEQIVASTQTAFNGLLSGTVYHARVRAINATGIETAYTSLGSTTTSPSSIPVFKTGTFQVTNALGTYIDGSLYSDTTTVNARVTVQSGQPPGLAVTDLPNAELIWQMDEGSGTSLVDATGHGNAGALQGSPLPTRTTGQTGDGLDFNGVDNYAVSATLNPWRNGVGTNAWTIELWFLATSNDDQGIIIQTADRNTGGGKHDADLTWDDATGNLKMSLKSDNGSPNAVYEAVATQRYDDGEWHHAAMVLNSSGFFLFVDGVQAASNTSQTAATARTYTNAFIWIGAGTDIHGNSGNNTRFYSGRVDGVQLWNLALPAGQIRTNYLRGRTGLRWGAPDVDVSTQSAADFTWSRLPAAGVSLTGTNGTTAEQTFTASNLNLRQTLSAGAPTNSVTFIASDLNGGVATGQYTILIDTTAPTNVALTALSAATTAGYTVTALTAADSPSGLDASPYRIEASTSAGFAPLAADSGWIAGNEHTFSSLDANTTYHFRIKARDAAGNESGYSTTRSSATLAQTVAGASAATVFASSAGVTWTPRPVSPSNAAAQGYTLEASSTAFSGGTIFSSATTNGTLGSLTVTGLTPNRIYTFRVGSLNWNGAPHYASAGSTVTLANPPTAVSLVSVATDTATVGWSVPSGGTSGYQLEASTMASFDPILSFATTANGSATSLSLSNLLPNVTHYFRVASLNSAGDRNDGAVLSTGTRANPPAAPSFDAVHVSSAMVSWSAGTGGAARYQVEAATQSDFSMLLASTVVSGSQTSATLTSLLPNATTYVRVAALNPNGVAAYGTTSSTSTRANAPESASLSSVWLTSATVNWAAPAGGATRYRLEASLNPNFASIAASSDSADGAVTPLTALSLAENTTYHLRIGARNHDGVYTYATALTTVTLAGAPTALAIDDVFISSAAFAWSAPAGGASGYELQASLSDDFSSLAASSATADGLDTTLAILSLAPNTTHFFRVASMNHGGISRFSTILTTSTLANEVNAPGFSAVHRSSLTAVWSAPMGGAAGYQLEASLASDFSSVAAASETANGAATALALTSLAANTTYYVRVGATNWNGVRTWRTAGSTSTLAGAPTGIAFTSVDESSAAVQWTPPVGGAAGFRLEASLSNDFSSVAASSDTSNGAATGLIVAGLAPHTTYHFRVGALNWNGEPVYAATLSTATRANAPPAPTFTSVATGTLGVSWSPPASGATAFRAEASTAADFTGTILSSSTSTGNETAIAIPALAANTTYHVRVGALNWNGVPTHAMAGSTSTLAQPAVKNPPDIVAVYAGSVTARWTARPASPPSETTEGYRLEASSTGFSGAGDVLDATSDEAGTASLAAMGLLPNTTYAFRIGTLNWNGVANFVSLDSTATLANAPVAPSIGQVHVSSVAVTWAVPAGGNRGFRLEASETNGFETIVDSSATTDAGATSLTLLSLLSDTTYYLRIGSLNWNGQANYLTVGSTRTRPSIDPSGPEGVADLAAETIATNAIKLTWRVPFDPTDDPLIGGFLIQYATTASVAWSTTSAQIVISTSNVASGTAVTHTAAGLDADTTHYFRLWTQDARPNTSPLSNGATAVTLANAPDNGAVASVFETSATLTWTALPISPSSASARGYRIEASSNAAFSEPVVISSTSDPGAATLAVSSLDRNTTYYFRIGSLNWAGQPNYAASASTSTLARAPNRLSDDFVAVYRSSAIVHWQGLAATPQPESAEGYRLEASSTNFSVGAPVVMSSTTDVGQSTLTLAGLLTNTTYQFRVGALNWNATPNYAALASTATLADRPVAGTPSFSLVEPARVTVAWTTATNPGDTTYRVNVSTSAAFDGTVYAATTTATSYTRTDLSPNATYHARVQALNRNDIATPFTLLGSTMTHASPPAAAAATFSAVESAGLTVSFANGSLPNPAGTVYTLEISSDDFTTAIASRTVSFSVAQSGLAINTTYFARVKAENDLGLETAYVTLGGTATLAVPPGVAVDTFTDIANRSFTLNWSSGSPATGFNSAGTRYVAQISIHADFSSEIIESETTGISAGFSGLSFGTTYYARVRAINHNGVETGFTTYGDVATTPSSEPEFVDETFEVTNAAGAYIDGDVYTDTTTVNVRVNVRSQFSPGLAVTDTPADLAIWHFNEGAGTAVADASFHAHPLSLQGAPPPSWTGSLLGQAIRFDGSQNRAVSGDLAPWRTAAANNAWTVELWFKSLSNQGYLFQASNKNTGFPSNFDLDIGWTNGTGRLAFALRTSGGAQRIAEASDSFADGNWHHVAAILNASGMHLYVDGTLAGSNGDITAGSAKTYDSAIYAWLGGAHLLDSNIGNGSQFASADIDEVRIATIAFTADQVAQSYALNRVQGHSLGGPAVDLSTNAGANFSWTRISTDVASISGSNGTTMEQTFSVTGLDLVQSDGPGAPTNQIHFTATDLAGSVTTGQFTILVDTTPPSGAGVSAFTAVTTGQIVVSLNTATDGASGLAESPYAIEIATLPGFGAVLDGSGWTDETTITIDGLDSNTTHFVRVRARDAAGNISGFSATAATPTLSLAVSDAHVVAVASDSATLTWTPLPTSPPADSAFGYRIEAATSASFSGLIRSSQTADASASGLTIPDLHPNTTYHFRVGSLNAANTPNFAAAGSSTTLTVLITDVATDAAAITSVTFSWTALPPALPDTSTATAEGYRLDLSTAPDFGIIFESVELADIQTSSWSFGGLSGDATYHFRIGGVNWSGAVNYAAAASTYLPAHLGVELSTDTIDLPELIDLNTTLVVSTSIAVTNTGNVTQTFSFSATTATAGSPWSISNVADVDRFVLWMIVGDTQPADGDFGAEDGLGEIDTPCSDTAMTAGDATCVAVPPGETRTIWMKLGMPTATSTGDPQQIRITGFGSPTD